MKVRIKQESGSYSPWILFTGDPMTAVLISPYMNESSVLPNIEIAPSCMEEVRFERDSRISNSDWTQTLDCPLSDVKVAEFAAYRKALRDIPQIYTAPDDVVWPEKPTI